MRITIAIGTSLLVGGALWLGAQAPDATVPEANVKDAPVRAVGLPPRAAAADYQYHAQAGALTICAEFVGHGVPTEEGGPYLTENYVVVEAALFGPPGAKVQLSYKDFSLRLNGKKQPEPSQSYVTVFPNLKDPEWEPLASETNLAATSVGGAGGTTQDRFKQAPPKMPMTLRHTMEQRVLRASLSEGERALPQAGLLFFEWHGETKGIRSMELLYNGAAGKAALTLHQP
jgi:hypothetical protein